MPQTDTDILILASASPRRRDLLQAAGIPFEVRAAEVDESRLAGESPEDLVLRLSRLKAEAISWLAPKRLVLGADTIVTLDHHLLGKPSDLADARRILRLLSGRTHEVLTGVTLCRQTPECSTSWIASTLVRFKELSDADIDRYLSAAHVLDKAGAYGIQDHGEMIVAGIDGLYSNVVGLPVEEVAEALARIGRD